MPLLPIPCSHWNTGGAWSRGLARCPCEDVNPSLPSSHWSSDFFPKSIPCQTSFYSLHVLELCTVRKCKRPANLQKKTNLYVPLCRKVTLTNLQRSLWNPLATLKTGSLIHELLILVYETFLKCDVYIISYCRIRIYNPYSMKCLCAIIYLN